MGLRFSQRMGLTPVEKAFQREALSQELRNQLWTALKLHVWDKWRYDDFGDKAPDAYRVEKLVTSIYHLLFEEAVDSVPDFDPDLGSRSGYTALRNRVMEDEWHHVLDLVEFIVQRAPDNWRNGLIAFLNDVFQQQNSAYRVVHNEITEITDETEIAAIADAADSRSSAVKQHIKRALELLADRSAPDYRNSIKESISAVEAACQNVSGSEGGTLGDCLKEIRKKHSIHPAMEQALLKLYGYTSDGGGIRHAMTEEGAHPRYEDAKFMLVSCAAFVNYLLALSAP